MEYLSTAADIIGILGAVFALFAWRKARQVQQELRHEQQRQQKKVTVVLQCGAKERELPIQLQRAELTRAEVMGILGMLPMKERGKRFSIDSVSTRDFLERINDIITSDGDRRLIIHCQQAEFDQFDFDAFGRKIV